MSDLSLHKQKPKEKNVRRDIFKLSNFPITANHLCDSQGLQLSREPDVAFSLKEGALNPLTPKLIPKGKHNSHERAQAPQALGLSFLFPRTEDGADSMARLSAGPHRSPCTRVYTTHTMVPRASVQTQPIRLTLPPSPVSLSLVLPDRVSLRSLGYPRTPSVDQAGLKPRPPCLCLPCQVGLTAPAGLGPPLP